MFFTNPLPRYIKSEIPVEILEQLSKGDCWIAGGFLRDMVYNKWQSESNLGKKPRVINDIDIFCKNEEVAERVYNVFYEKSNDDDNIVSSGFGAWISRLPFIYKGKKINVICHKFFDNQQALLENFNFRCNMFSTDGESLFEYEYAWKDNMNDKLVVFNFTNPISFLFKMQKYNKKGMVMGRDEIAKLLLRIKLSDYDLTDSSIWYEDNEDL